MGLLCDGEDAVKNSLESALQQESRQAVTRRMLIWTVPTLASLTLLVWFYQVRHAPPPSPPPAPAPASTAAASPSPWHQAWRSPAESPPPARATEAPTAGPSASGADPGRIEDGLPRAIHRFQFESMPVIDACLGPTPAPRALQQVLVTFEQKEPGGTSGERFMAAAVHVLSAPGTEVSPESPVGRCLQRLEGRELIVPAGSVPQGPRFEETLTLFLPAPSAT
jgi:hypothetical protein